MKVFLSKLFRPKTLLTLGAVGAALLVALLLYLNGPGFRLIVSKSIAAYAKKEGFVTEYSLSGSALKGLEINALQIRPKGVGTFPIRSLKLGGLDLKYKLGELIRHAAEMDWLQQLQLSDVKLDVDLAALDDASSPSKAKATQLALPEFAALWNLLRSEIELSNVDVLIRNGDAVVLALNGLNARTYDSTEQGYLKIKELKITNLPVIENLDSYLINDGDSLRTSINLKEWGIAVPTLALTTDASETQAKLLGQLQAGGGKVDFSAGSDAILMELTEGIIEFKKIKPLAVAVPDVAATIKQLDLKMVGEHLEGRLELINLGYKEEIKVATVSAALSDIYFDFNQQIATRGSINLQTKRLDIFGAAIESVVVSGKVTEPNVVTLSATDSQNQLQINGTLQQNSLTYNAKGQVNARLDQLTKIEIGGAANVEWQGQGELRQGNHKGLAQVELKQFEFGGSKQIDGEFNLGYANQQLQLRELDLQHHDDGSVRLTGSADLAEQSLQLNSIALVRDQVNRLLLNGEVTLDTDLAKSQANLNCVANQLDPNDLAGFFLKDFPVKGVVNGKLSASGAFNDLLAKADFIFTPEFQETQQEPDIHLVADFSGDVTVPKTWDLDANAVVSGLTYGETLLEDLSAKVSTNEQGVLLGNISIDQSGSTVRGRVKANLAEASELQALQQIPLQAEFDLVVPKLEALRRAFPFKAWRDLPITGDIKASLDQLVLQQGNLINGTANVSAKSLAVEGQAFQKFLLRGTISEPNYMQTKLDIALDDLATVGGNVGYHLKDKSYQGALKLDANLTRKGKLRALLADRVAADILPEVTHIDWQGSGNIINKKFQNDIKLDIERFRLASGAEPIDVKTSGRLSDHSAEFSELLITGRDLAIKGGLNWQDNRIQLKSLQGQFQGRQFLTGSAEAPLNPQGFQVTEWFASRSPLAIKLSVLDAPIEGLARFVSPDVPVQGRLNLEFDTVGSPASPEVDLTINAVDLVMVDPKGKVFDLGFLTTELLAKNEIARINGRFKHPEFKPLTFSGQQPFHLGDWATKRRDWQIEPLQLELKLEPSSLAIFAPKLPEIRSLIGTVATDVTVGGTFLKPSLDGFAQLDVTRLKLRNRAAPSIRDMSSLVRFKNAEVLLEKFEALVAGGLLKASGRADIVEGDARIDLSIIGKDVLVFRNHDINVRTDVDLKAQGLWSQLNLSGEVGINNSYFVKNIDLMPTSLPQFKRSNVPSVDTGNPGAAISDLSVGVPIEPFSNWNTDIRIFTKSPFLIRGNIGHGSAQCDLRVVGPLSAPYPVGELLVDEGTRLTLPFSRIDIETGRIRFNELTSFNGQLELKARGKADQYDVNIFLHDRLFSPKYVLTSNPQLPTEDILTLLATGNVRDDLVGSGVTQLAASKAASLFLKNLNKNSNAQSQSALINKLRDRTEVDFGSFNLDNGISSVGGRIRLWKQLFFVGNATWDDEYRALLKYIFSFS